MLKASAWPYPVFEDVAYEMTAATFQTRALKKKVTHRGAIIEAQGLRELGEGEVLLDVKILTSANEVSNAVFNINTTAGIIAGFRVLCELTKHRQFYAVEPSTGEVQIAIPLGKVRGVVSVMPIFKAAAPPEGSVVPPGATIGIARTSIFLTIDEDWTGEQIPIDWLDFAAQTPPLPDESFVHVELSGSGEIVPKAWLNKKFEPEIGTIINHAGLNSPQGLARNIFRQFILSHIWQNVLIWAIKHEDVENANWPSTRIATMWRERFREFDWELPAKGDLTFEIADEISLKIQHCLKTGQELSHVSKFWNF